MANYIRWMIAKDMPAVLAIEAATGGNWNHDDFMNCLRQRNCIGMVAEDSDHVIGFTVYELHEKHIGVLRVATMTRDAYMSLVNRIHYKLEQHRREKLSWHCFGVSTPVVPSAWRTSTVRMLARDVEVPLPILADALQDAGCEDARILEPFRKENDIGRVTFAFLRDVLAA